MSVPVVRPMCTKEGDRKRKVKLRKQMGEYLKVIGLVVVNVDHTEDLRVPGYREVVRAGRAICQSLPGKLFHLDVVELAEVAEPLDEL